MKHLYVNSEVMRLDNLHGYYSSVKWYEILTIHIEKNVIAMTGSFKLNSYKFAYNPECNIDSVEGLAEYSDNMVDDLFCNNPGLGFYDSYLSNNASIIYVEAIRLTWL